MLAASRACVMVNPGGARMARAQAQLGDRVQAVHWT